MSTDLQLLTLLELVQLGKALDEFFIHLRCTIALWALSNAVFEAIRSQEVRF